MDKPMTGGVGNITSRSRGLPVEKVTSTDGTAIAFERSGDGPPLVIIGGGLNEKATFGTLSELLGEKFTVLNYDRRGRGDSGDGDRDRYTIDREIDDLAAVLDAAGAPSVVFANCTGGMIAVEAAARGVPMVKLALYEPPYGSPEERPQVPPDYLDRLTALIAQGRNSDAVVLFQRESVGFADEFIAQFQKHPAWPAFEALAPTLLYDTIIGNPGLIPFDRLARITAPTLVVDGGDSPAWQQHACEDIARALPNGTHARVPGQSHIMNKQATAPVLLDFLAD